MAVQKCLKRFHCFPVLAAPEMRPAERVPGSSNVFPFRNVLDVAREEFFRAGHVIQLIDAFGGPEQCFLPTFRSR